MTDHLSRRHNAMLNLRRTVTARTRPQDVDRKEQLLLSLATSRMTWRDLVAVRNLIDLLDARTPARRRTRAK